MKAHPLRLIALLISFVLLASGVSHAAQSAKAGEKYTFVLVHGATAGGWEWKSTSKFLSDDGVATLIEQSVNDQNKGTAPTH